MLCLLGFDLIREYSGSRYGLHGRIAEHKLLVTDNVTRPRPWLVVNRNKRESHRHAAGKLYPIGAQQYFRFLSRRYVF